MEIRFTTLPLNENSYKIPIQWNEYMTLKATRVSCELNKDTTRPIFSGYLIKQGKKIRNLKKRWFVLYPDRLCYFHKPHFWPAKGEILVKSMTTLYMPFNITPEMPYPFIISCPYREYIITAESEKGREEWVTVISAAIQNISKEIKIQ